MLQHNKARYQPFWSDPLNPIFCLSLIFLAGTLRSLPVQVRLLLVLAAADCGFIKFSISCAFVLGVGEPHTLTPTPFALPLCVTVL